MRPRPLYSECTRNDLLAFAAAVGRPAPTAEVVLLGANVPAEPSACEFSVPGLRDRLARRRFALTVGTFEIRKNYRMLIDLWHELVDDETFDLDLVIVGMAGWRVDDILDQAGVPRLCSVPGYSGFKGSPTLACPGYTTIAICSCTQPLRRMGVTSR